MAPGIAEALRPLRPDAQRQVVLVTDGLIGFEQEIVAAVRRDLPPASRLHTIGVGSSVNRSLTAPAARAGRGIEVVIGLDEEPAEAARKLVARTRAPLLTDLVIEGSVLLGHAPARVPDLLAAGPALIGVQLRSTGGSLRVRGRTPAGAWEADVDVPALEPGKGSAAVVTVYGREAVEDLELRAASGEESVDAEIERLGLQFQIATRLTSWVAVSEEPAVDPTQPSRRERMPHALPAGMSVEGLGLRGAPSIVARLSSHAPVSPSPTSRRDDRLSLSLRNTLVDYDGALDAVALLRREPDREETSLSGRIVHRRGRELVIEILPGRVIDWNPQAAEVAWADGTRLAATIDRSHTTRTDRIATGLLIRLVLHLDHEGPSPAPAVLFVRGAAGPLIVTLSP
jgi:hypothetical protein